MMIQNMPINQCNTVHKQNKGRNSHNLFQKMQKKPLAKFNNNIVDKNIEKS
jgi:hypothetical protein